MQLRVSLQDDLIPSADVTGYEGLEYSRGLEEGVGEVGGSKGKDSILTPSCQHFSA